MSVGSVGDVASMRTPVRSSVPCRDTARMYAAGPPLVATSGTAQSSTPQV